MKKVKILNWPDTFRSQYDSNRTSHAYISHCCRAAVIVYNEKHDISNEDPFKSALIQAVHDWTISDARDKWVVLGDETGTLGEFESKKPNNKDTSVMCWLVVPPGIQLPTLKPDFHCTGKNGKVEQLQYSEFVDIFFHRTEAEGKGDLINWPHVMTNTLTKEVQ